jgi:glutamate carboxypeptidase
MNLQEYIQSTLPQCISYLQQMVSINSFTSNSQGVNQLGRLTGEIFANLGFQADFVQSDNPNFGQHLFLTRPVRSKLTEPGKPMPAIAMISHLDTVFPPEEEQQNDFHWREEGDRIYGPGTVDIKGGTVMMYLVLDGLRAFAPHTFEAVEWHLALDASEEALSDDFGRLCLERFPEHTLACLVFEGGTPNTKSFPIVVARKGRATFNISIEGRSAHAGNNHALGANAILQLAHTIQQIEALTNYEKKITFNVGTISGGSVINRVPHYARAGVEMRAFSPDIFEEGVQAIMRLNGAGRITSTNGFPCKVTIQPVYRSSPWPRNPATDHLFNIWQSAADLLGLWLKTEERGGLSDGNLIWNKIPVLDGLGPTGDNAHCSEQSPDGSKEQEYTLISSFVPKAMLNITAIIKLVEEVRTNP